MTFSVSLPPISDLRADVRANEIVVYCGDTKSNPVNVSPYVATVLNNGSTVATYNLPQHDRFASWVHEINPDKIIRTNLDIVQQGLMFPYGYPGQKKPAGCSNTFGGPLTSGGITLGMGSTGERNDIGLLPEWEAEAMQTGNFAPCLAAAKGYRSMPIFMIDPVTKRFPDMIAHPLTTIYWNQSNIPDFIASAPSGQWDMDISHHPATYVAYLATGQTRYLESLQAITTYGFLVTNWYSQTMGYPVVCIAQMRACGWHFRSLLMCWKATQLAEKDNGGPLPPPFMPASYWKQLIDLQLKFFTENYVQDPAIQAFRYFPDKTSYRPWQFDYVLLSLALAAFFFPGTAWEDVFLWALDNPIKRLNGKSGWPPAHQEPYFLRLGPVGVMPDATNSFPFDLKPPQFFADDAQSTAWAKAWAEVVRAAKKDGNLQNMTMAQIDALIADPFGGGDFINWDPYTPQQLRNVMAAADILDQRGCPVRAKNPDFDLCFQRITSMVTRWEARSSGNVIAARVSILSNVNLPPAGTLHMSSNGNVSVGATVHATLTFDDGKGGPSQPPVNLQYAVSPPEVATAAADATGVNVTGVAPGPYTLTASADNLAPVSLSGVVTLPLAGALHLAWD